MLQYFSLQQGTGVKEMQMFSKSITSESNADAGTPTYLSENGNRNFTVIYTTREELDIYLS